MQLFINNWASRLAGPLSSSALTMQIPTEDAGLLAGLGAGDYYLLTLVGVDALGIETAHEVIRVTAVAGSVLTIERAQEGSAALDWSISTRVEARYTAGAAAAPAQALAAHEQAANPHPQYQRVAGVRVVASAAYSLTIEDAWQFIEFTSADPVTVSIPGQAAVDWPADVEIHLCQASAGVVSVAEAGVAVARPSSQSLSTAEQGAVVTLKRRAADSWRVFGLLGTLA